MHIAICDDNVADRKHIERLLARESDKRYGTPNVLYIDSFGSKEHFFRNQIKYDLYIIDMVSTPTIAQEIVEELLEMGTKAPIIMYSSKIDHSANPNLPASIIHMKKPYVPDPLPELLKLGDQHVIGDVEMITVHSNSKKVSIPAADIFYSYRNLDGHTLVKKDGTFLQIDETIGELQCILERYHQYMRISARAIINVELTTMITPFSVMMQDYKQFVYPIHYYPGLRKLKEKLTYNDNY